MATEKSKKPKQASKKAQVMDVSKPGKTAPSASSRPVIVGHKPALQDPMVTADKDEKPAIDSEAHKITVSRTGPKIVAPLNAAEEPAEDDNTLHAETAPPLEVPSALTEEEATDADTPEPESAESESILPPESPLEEPEQPAVTPKETPDSTPPSSTSSRQPKESGKEPKNQPKDKADNRSSIVAAVADQAAKGKANKDTSLDAQIQKQQAQIDKLVEEKKYFVHTAHTAKAKRTSRNALALLIVLIVLIGVYLALDAQVVKNNIQLPYEFFKETKQSESSPPPVPDGTPKNPVSEDKDEKDTKNAFTFTGQTVESPNKLYSLKIPDGWRVTLSEASDDLHSVQGGTSGEYAEYIVYKSGTKPVVRTVPDMAGGDAPIRFLIRHTAADEATPFIDGNEQKLDFATDAGIKGMRYYEQVPVEPADGLTYPGEKRYVYEFKSAARKIVVAYRIMEKNQYTQDRITVSDKDQIELIDAVVKSLQIK